MFLTYAAAIRRHLAQTTRSPIQRVVSAPLFTVGYILLLIGLARLVALGLGWSANLFLVGLGALHVALGIIVATAAVEPADPGDETSFQAADTLQMALERADTLVTDPPRARAVAAALAPPEFPPRTRLSF
jgi:hypothetical protein